MTATDGGTSTPDDARPVRHSVDVSTAPSPGGTGASARLAWTAMPDSQPAVERRGRALMGVVAASALVYPLLVCAVQLVVAQLLRADVPAVALWLSLSVACCVAVVAAVRWGAARPVLSPWLLAGLVPPALFELWLLWPQLAP